MRINQFEFVQKESSPFGRVIIVGMMEDGPTGAPFRLLEEKNARFLLGDNEVSRAYEHLINSGVEKENIVLFRLNGEPSYFKLDVIWDTSIVLQSLTSSSWDNDVHVRVNGLGLTIKSNYPEELLETGARKNFSRTYHFTDYGYTSNLSEAITKDAMLGLHNVIARDENIYHSQLITMDEDDFFFDGGKTEAHLTVKDGSFKDISNEDRENLLNDYWQRFYYHLLGNDFDGETTGKLLDISAEAIYFPDVFIDDIPELAILAGRIAKEKTESQDVLCSALFRTSIVPEKETTEHKLFIEKLDNLFSLEEHGFQEMKNVQIVVGEDESALREIIPGATHHLVNLLNKELIPTTNKELVNFHEVKTPLDKDVIDKLSSKGYICIVESIRRNVVTSKVQSMYSDELRKDVFYHNKILSYIKHDIRNMLDVFIGSNLTMYNLVSVEDQINEYLQQYIDARLIESFTLGERVSDEIGYSSNIAIELKLFGETERIKGSMKLNESGWEVDLWTIID